MDIVTVGDNCIDDYSFERKSFPGGNAVNVAVYLKRYEVNTSYIGVVGSDGNGKRMIESINNQGVDVSHVLIKEGKTAVTTVVLNGGERKFTGYDEGVLRDFILSKENIQYVKKHKIVHSAISGHCEDYFKEFQKSGLITSFDFSNEVESPLINKLASYVDY
ncbi:fructoselysine 6-kinase, partial [Virgibacillus indicus]